jgi:hypothetical protein
VKLQRLSFLEYTSSPHSKPLDYVIKAGLDEIIPVYTPAHQTGDLEKILVAFE